MPELPEVETIRRALAPVLEGRIIETVELLHPRVTRHDDPERLGRLLPGQRIEAIDRRGKFLRFQLSEDLPALVCHLRMSGQLLLNSGPLASPHLRAQFTFRDGEPRLGFVDVRTFGTLFFEDVGPPGFARLGVEPLNKAFTAAKLRTLYGNRRAPVKSLLLSQELVAGIGNIYASEICWEVGLHPSRAGNSLSDCELRRLHRAIRRVLKRAVEEMGTTLSDFRRPDGTPGEYGNSLQVYGREGQECRRCGGLIERMTHHGRSSFFCPRCQHTASSC